MRGSDVLRAARSARRRNGCTATVGRLPYSAKPVRWSGRVRGSDDLMAASDPPRSLVRSLQRSCWPRESKPNLRPRPKDWVKPRPRMTGGGASLLVRGCGSLGSIVGTRPGHPVRTPRRFVRFGSACVPTSGRVDGTVSTRASETRSGAKAYSRS